MAPVNLREATQYVSKSIVPASAGRKCIDGRYLPNQATGMIARPGGDGGYVMALLAVNQRKKLGLTPEQCFNAVYKVVSKSGEGFCLHTDQFADPTNHDHRRLIGCGHIAKAASKKFAKSYDVSGDDVRRIVAYARNICEISRTVHMVNLAGYHKERGVIIVQSKDYSVLADNPKLGQMYFIYDDERDNGFLKNLVKEMHIKGLTFEDMKKESDLQLQATLHNLALGLPIFAVDFDGKQPTVTAMGSVSLPQSAKRFPALHEFPRLFHPKIQRFTPKN
ncbi:MAG: hypothetical protein AAB553_07080 [Patescibacteria group bacterium]